MDPAYFQGRKLILEWINDVCDLNLAKVEQTCSGAIACQLLDSIFPGKVPMSRVDWGAKVDYEFINNYKILQNCFLKLKIDKPIYMEKLIRGRYQDNLEFMQWFKGFYDNSTNVDNYLELGYEAQAQRNKGKSGQQYHAKYGKGGVSGAKKTVSRTTSSSRIPASSSTRTTRAPASKSSSVSSAAVEEFKSKIRSLEKQTAELSTENEQLSADVEHCNETIKEVEKERNYYYNKLQRVETFLINLREDQMNQTSEDVKNILYAEAEEDDHLLKDDEVCEGKEQDPSDKYRAVVAQNPEEEETH